VLQKLARFGGDPDYEIRARKSINALQQYLAEAPLGFGQWLTALENALATHTEVAVVGDVDSDTSRALIEVAQSGYTPHRLVAAGEGDVPPLLMHREQIEGLPTAYVCRRHVCQAPVAAPDDLRTQLA
jgi:hypothetical protein